MKTAISIPDELFQNADKTAKELGISRSELYAKAIRHFLEERHRQQIVNQLNAFYETHDSRLDPALARMQSLSIGRSGWPQEPLEASETR